MENDGQAVVLTPKATVCLIHFFQQPACRLMSEWIARRFAALAFVQMSLESGPPLTNPLQYAVATDMITIAIPRQ
eukprot:1397397-Amphidinium_carterae.1